MAIVCMDLTVLPKVIGLTQPNSFWIPTPNRLPDPYVGAMHSSAIPSDDPDADLSLDERDSAEGLPKCVVVDPAFSWGQDAPLRIPWHKTLIYEMHVKGFTARHPKVPKELRGTYAGSDLSGGRRLS